MIAHRLTGSQLEFPPLTNVLWQKVGLEFLRWERLCFDKYPLGGLYNAEMERINSDVVDALFAIKWL